MSLLTPKQARIGVPLVLFFLALAVRLIGIGWGLKNDLHNQSYHPDEEVIFNYSRNIDPAHLNFTPGFYNYGTLYLTTLKVASDMTAAYTGGDDTKNAEAHWSFVARCNFAGRILSAIAGAGTVLVVFLILRRFAGLIGSVGGALMLAFAPAHVVHSRFQTVDVTALFLLALSALFAFLLLPREGDDPPSEKLNLRWLILAGLFAGLSGGTKYTGVLGVLTLLVVVFMCRRPTFWKDAAIGVASTAVGFFIGTPGVLLDHDAFMRDFNYETAHVSTGHGLLFEGTSNGFVYHFGNLLEGFGGLALLLALAALGYAAYRKQVWALALLAFMVPYYFVIGRADVMFMRYTFPLYVGLAVAFGWAIDKAVKLQVAGSSVSVKRLTIGRATISAGIFALGGIPAGGLRGVITYTSYMVAEDPRDSAARYLKSQAQEATVVGLPEDPWFWSAPLFPDSTTSRMMSPKRREQAMDAAVKPKVTYFHDPATGQPTQFDKRLITDVKPDYVTYSSLEYQDPERLAGRKDIPGDGQSVADHYKDFLAALSSGYTADHSFGDDLNTVQDMEYVQTRVVVWKRKPTP